MKTLKTLAFTFLILPLFAVAAFAQSYTISNTTLNGAITATQTTLVLTSASASSGSSFGAPAAGQCLFVDGELMRIVSMSSTTATVQRQSVGAVGHPSLAVVWTAPCNAFKKGDPPVFAPLGVGVTNNVAKSSTQIDCSKQPAPWINVDSANIWWCNTKNNVWTGTNYRALTYNSVPVAQ